MTNYDEILDEGLDLPDEDYASPSFEVWCLVYDEDGIEHVDFAECLGIYETEEQAETVVDEITGVSDLLTDEALMNIIDNVGYGGRLEIRVEDASDSLLDNSDVIYSKELYY
jgi:hypothetical protein